MFKKILVVLTLALFCATPVLAKDAPAPGKNPLVEIETTLGTITVELFAKEAPITVKNFLEYATSGFYSGTVFHRIIPGFMIQGGGLTAELQPKPGSNPAIKNEAGNGLKNERGTLSMARSGMVDSATSQFFINVGNNESLNHRDDTIGGFGYAVFGKVVKGMEVADMIVSAPQERKNSVFQNVPKTAVVIKSVKVLK
jgi:cyclophilin family peptidyl-prolyl cis-trans isomerase